MFSSAAVEVTPSRIFNSASEALIAVVPVRPLNWVFRTVFNILRWSSPCATESLVVGFVAVNWLMYVAVSNAIEYLPLTHI
jgi:hypothetical protein